MLRPPLELELGGLGSRKCASPPALSMIPLNQYLQVDCQVSETVQIEPTIMTMAPSSGTAAHIVLKDARELVHRPTGPACAFVGVAHPLKGYGGCSSLEVPRDASRICKLLGLKGLKLAPTGPNLHASGGKSFICTSRGNQAGSTLHLSLRALRPPSNHR